MRQLLALILSLGMTICVQAQENESASTPDQSEQSISSRVEPTPAEKKVLEQETVDVLIEEYNANIDEDMDELICKKERVTGSRRKVQICKTRREIEEEAAATERLMRSRSRSSSVPAAGGGQGVL